MDQNNFNNPNFAATETREPLPQFGNQPQGDMGQPPVYQQPIYQQQAPYQQPTYQQSASAPQNAEVEASAGSAFGKTLAAVIMAWFPICSIVSIILASIGLRIVNKTNEMAAYYGVSAGGKNIAAKIMGIIGLVSGIVMTVIYSLYILLIIVAISLAI